MSLTLIRRLVLAGALAAALLGGGIASAEDGDAPAEGAVAAVDAGQLYADEGDFLYADPAMVSKGALESALTTVLSTCRTGLLATRVTVMRNEIDPSSGYLLVAEVTEFGRSTQEKLTASMLDSCFSAMDVSMVDKGALDKALETITTQMEALLAMP